jgi:hypothetical protein
VRLWPFFETNDQETNHMITMNQLVAMEAATHNRKTPSDIDALLASTYFSQSLQEQREMGELSLPQFIRVMKKGGQS